ncbi:BMP family ABC transporter substrate-binding protein [Noviherbaspirillum pedocola]|uniref:BMP family ABC transporter substrate-binding protein n=1 Tax=Noviherbaspirillum pedocola TaxID=2801341 RepID=A0A934SPM0_9BURK|nr:BMP family ABC transporter substrate-binding protein [Noviherbaspirillum pedocola]MBK4733144.1 BMP family ABC transporter substrate-binding protein [Noviherbaspirillum pedocola]
MPDMKKRSTLKAGLLVAASTMMLVACGEKTENKTAAAPAAAPAPAAAAASGPLKVAYVYVGPVGDAGWTFAHDAARKAVEADFGDKIQTTYVEKVAEGADAERVFRDLASQGNKLIFGTSFGYMEQMLKVAKDFPDVKFEHATGYKTAPNLAVYETRTYQGAYLAGVLAGKMTKSNKLGVVASFPIPEVIRNINAFTRGAQSVNPNISTRAVWVSSWFDPAKERDAAMTMIGQGVDVLIQNTDSPATLQAAEEKGVYAFGWDSDMSSFGPKAHLASAVINWEPYYKQTIQSVLNGSWKNGTTWWGVKENSIDLVNVNPVVPDEAKKAMQDAKATMASGKDIAFAGPIVDQSGKEVLAAGKDPDEGMLKGMNFYVKGVEGSIPK